MTVKWLFNALMIPATAWPLLFPFPVSVSMLCERLCALLTLDRQAHRGTCHLLHPAHQTRGCSLWQSDKREDRIVITNTYIKLLSNYLVRGVSDTENINNPKMRLRENAEKAVKMDEGANLKVRFLFII